MRRLSVVLALAALGCGDAVAPSDADRLRFMALSAGATHSCGRTTGGETYCWGSNLVGELGARTGKEANPLPLQVVVRPLELTTISAGATSSCGMLNTGLPLCWGSGESSPRPLENTGQLLSLSAGEFVCALRGDGSATCWDDQDASPYQVQGPGFTRLAVGGIACGLATDGAAWCWPKGATVAELVPGGLTFTSITVGRGHACGIRADGFAYCWGQNDRGQLGDRTRLSRTTPDSVVGLQVWQQLSAGQMHTCGVSTNGGAFCWGDGTFGQLGADGAVGGGYSSSPLRVRGAALPAGLQWATVSAGFQHSCGSSTDGLTFCWGSNGFGQLGSGNLIASPSPVAIGSGD